MVLDRLMVKSATGCPGSRDMLNSFMTSCVEAIKVKRNNSGTLLMQTVSTCI